jgi:hypothetical protein
VRRRRPNLPQLGSAKSLDRVVTVASSLFVIGNDKRPRRPSITHRPTSAADDFPRLSQTVTVGRNSYFKHLSKKDREELGGIEYRSLKLLLKIVLGRFAANTSRVMFADVGRVRVCATCFRHCWPPRLDLQDKPQISRLLGTVWNEQNMVVSYSSIYICPSRTSSSYTTQGYIFSTNDGRQSGVHTDGRLDDLV